MANTRGIGDLAVHVSRVMSDTLVSFCRVAVIDPLDGTGGGAAGVAPGGGGNSSSGVNAALACLAEAGAAQAEVGIVVDTSAGIVWTDVNASGFPAIVVLPSTAELPVTNTTASNEQLFVVLTLATTTVSTTFIPPLPTIIIHEPPNDRTERGASHNRVVIFVGFCIACFFVSSLYCRTRTAQVQNNAALRRSMWLVSLLENEATSQQRLQLRSEAAGRIIASLPVRTVGEPDPDDPDHAVVVAPEDCCCICIDEYGGGDKIARLPCGHDFHSDCIAPWLQQQCTCPLCKRDLVEASGEDPAPFADPPNVPPEGWRAFLEQLLENQAIEASQQDQRRLAQAAEAAELDRPEAPPPPDDQPPDNYAYEYFMVDFEEQVVADAPPPQPAPPTEEGEAEVVPQAAPPSNPGTLSI